MCDKNSFAAAHMNLKLKNAELKAKVMLKFNFVFKTSETLTSVRPAILSGLVLYQRTQFYTALMIPGKATTRRWSLRD